MRLFVEPGQLVTGDLIVRGDEHHYLSRVRRARVADVVELTDGAGRRAPATVAAIGPRETRVVVGPVEDVPLLSPAVRVLLPLIKGDRMDDCVEKLVEVGVTDVVVWQAQRSVVTLGRPDRLAPRRDHYRGVAKAAARQSGCVRVPSVELRGSLADALRGHDTGTGFVLDPSAPRAGMPGGVADVTLVSGPEGGLAPEELELLTAARFSPLGLGPRVLRADTAPVIAVAMLRAATNS
jgi:16S rRNA (uracil1498-N3)-methyltransferase